MEIKVANVGTEKDYLKELFVLIEKDDISKFNVLWISIEMAAKNSSLRKDEQASGYFYKVLHDLNRGSQKEGGFRISIEEYLSSKNIGDNYLAVIGRALHNITYLDGAMEISIQEIGNKLFVQNKYKKLGINRVFVRKEELKNN